MVVKLRTHVAKFMVKLLSLPRPLVIAERFWLVAVLVRTTRHTGGTLATAQA